MNITIQSSIYNSHKNSTCINIHNSVYMRPHKPWSSLCLSRNQTYLFLEGARLLSFLAPHFLYEVVEQRLAVSHFLDALETFFFAVFRRKVTEGRPERMHIYRFTGPQTT